MQPLVRYLFHIIVEMFSVLIPDFNLEYIAIVYHFSTHAGSREVDWIMASERPYGKGKVVIL